MATKTASRNGSKASSSRSKTSTRRRPASKNGNGNGRARSASQAQRYAKESRAKVDKKREKADGAAGWVAERAGDWDLEAQDMAFMERQKYFWNPLIDYWFRMEMEGFDRLPDPPALLIGIHSGAPFVWDAWTVGIQWWRHFGDERRLHGTAHDALMAAPLIGNYFRRMGVLPAAPDSISTALAEGHDVALWPGGEIDSLRPWTQRDQAILAGRKGFIKMAIRAQVPIVPISTVGGPDSMPILTSGRRLAKVFSFARIKRMPLAISAPWGISPAMLPEIPFPTKIRTAFQDPIEVDHDPDRVNDDEYLTKKYCEVQNSIQHGMDVLARRRRLPLFG